VDRPDVLGEAMAAVAVLWREGKVRPRVDSTYPFERAADAHRRMHDRKNVGKVVLAPAEYETPTGDTAAQMAQMIGGWGLTPYITDVEWRFQGRGLFIVPPW
jgi:Zinc-binding dehydrogenase